LDFKSLKKIVTNVSKK